MSLVAFIKLFSTHAVYRVLSHLKNMCSIYLLFFSTYTTKKRTLFDVHIVANFHHKKYNSFDDGNCFSLPWQGLDWTTDLFNFRWRFFNNGNSSFKKSRQIFWTPKFNPIKLTFHDGNPPWNLFRESGRKSLPKFRLGGLFRDLRGNNCTLNDEFPPCKDWGFIKTLPPNRQTKKSVDFTADSVCSCLRRLLLPPFSPPTARLR